MKQIYMITYPAGKIYIGKDGVGSPDMDVIISDFELAAEFARKDYTNRKQILWESENCTESELSDGQCVRACSGPGIKEALDSYHRTAGLARSRFDCVGATTADFLAGYRPPQTRQDRSIPLHETPAALSSRTTKRLFTVGEGSRITRVLLWGDRCARERS